MNEKRKEDEAADCNPVFSVAGAMPGGSTMRWDTAYPNPDEEHAHPHPVGHGPSLSIAGVMPGTAEVGWRTAMPDPSRDTLDSHGYIITKAEAAARAELAHTAPPLALENRAEDEVA